MPSMLPQPLLALAIALGIELPAGARNFWRSGQSEH